MSRLIIPGLLLVLLLLIPVSTDNTPRTRIPDGPIQSAPEIVRVSTVGLTGPRRLLSTGFWPGDGMSGSLVGCASKARELYRTVFFKELIAQSVPVIATRGKRRPYACGDWLLLRNPRNQKWSSGVKLDTGPWSCYLGNRRITALICPPSWSRKSHMDLSKTILEDLEHVGLQEIEVWKMLPQ